MYKYSSDDKISKRIELQGPRPAALRVGKDSFKIKKPGGGQPPRPPPVIIHLKSPDIIHIKPQDFMKIVQQLTGKPPTSSACRMVDDLKIQGSADDDNLEVKESITLPSGGSPGMSASSAQSNFSMFSSAFLPSPNVYSNWMDFGPIY